MEKRFETKKLSLNKETVRSLSEVQAADVAGGRSNGGTCNWSCFWSCGIICPPTGNCPVSVRVC
ncbi:MAG: hypothetical protein HY014_12095 [Acidobacteria bacterium]|nr:hypothetical protein [Acidobacteriota bacterium]MBI3488896.1 hypothetical protein [Acidobacteriota bacterium]